MKPSRFESPRPQPTQTAWPATTRPQTTAAPVPRRIEVVIDERRDDEHVIDEPGYGHGV